jgi:hypothetical protein
MARACLICSDSAKLAKAAQLVAAGSSDQAIANALNAMTPDLPPMSYMVVLRHRHNHIVAPAKALADAALKGREVAAQRAQLIAAAEAGDPAAFLALSAIVDGLRRTDERLERVAASAEQDGQRLAVSALSGQQIRMGEMKAKLGGHGGYSQPKASGDSAGRSFQVNIIFSRSQRTETIAMTAIDSCITDVQGGPDALDVDEVADRG